MSPSLPTDQKKNDQRKWALAAALTLVLVTILLFRSDENAGESDDRSAVAHASVDVPASRQLESRDTPPVDDRTATASWPDWDVTELVELDPFELPTPLNAHLAMAQQLNEDASDAKRRLEEEKAYERRQRIERVLSELMTRQVSAVLTSDKGRSALVGSQWVSEGEVFDGVRFVKIDTQGVTVEIVEEPQRPGNEPKQQLPPAPVDPQPVP